MSIKMMSQVWKPASEGGSPYNGRKLLLHLALADFADDGGVCWPSQDTLATKCRMSPKWVSVTVIEMAKDGYLVRLKRGGKNVGSAKYRLKFPQGQPEVASPDAKVNQYSAVGQPEVGSISTGNDFVQPISNHQESPLLRALRKEFPSATEAEAQLLGDHGVAILEISLIVQSMRDTYSKPQYVTLNSFTKHFPSHRPDKDTLVRAQRQEALDDLNLDMAMYGRVKDCVLELGQDPTQAVSIAEALDRSRADHARTDAERTVEGWKSYLHDLSSGQGMTVEHFNRCREMFPYENLFTALDQIQRDYEAIDRTYFIDDAELGDPGSSTDPVETPAPDNPVSLSSIFTAVFLDFTHSETLNHANRPYHDDKYAVFLKVLDLIGSRLDTGPEWLAKDILSRSIDLFDLEDQECLDCIVTLSREAFSAQHCNEAF